MMNSVDSSLNIPHLEDHDRYLIVGDWDDVPATATHLAVGTRNQDLSRLSEFKSLKHLQICCGDQALMSLGKLPTLRVLRISATKRLPLTSLEPLRNVALLERLILHDVPIVHSLDGISALTTLKDVVIENSPGSVTKRHEIDSLQPLADLQRLERLELRGIRVRDYGLRPLEAMTWLRRLVVNNHFEIEDFARLAAALPNTQGYCLQPTVPSGIPCNRCKFEKLMLIGRTRPMFACPQCQARHVAKHVAAFEKFRTEASRD